MRGDSLTSALRPLSSRCFRLRTGRLSPRDRHCLPAAIVEPISRGSGIANETIERILLVDTPGALDLVVPVSNRVFDVGIRSGTRRRLRTTNNNRVTLACATDTPAVASYVRWC
jgi:hypothetical protein